MAKEKRLRRKKGQLERSHRCKQCKNRYQCLKTLRKHIKQKHNNTNSRSSVSKINSSVARSEYLPGNSLQQNNSKSSNERPVNQSQNKRMTRYIQRMDSTEMNNENKVQSNNACAYCLMNLRDCTCKIKFDETKYEKSLKLLKSMDLKTFLIQTNKIYTPFRNLNTSPFKIDVENIVKNLKNTEFKSKKNEILKLQIRMSDTLKQYLEFQALALNEESANQIMSIILCFFTQQNKDPNKLKNFLQRNKEHFPILSKQNEDSISQFARGLIYVKFLTEQRGKLFDS